MNLKKITVVWSSSWHTFLSVPLANWLGLLALMIKRFYTGLCNLPSAALALTLLTLAFFTGAGSTSSYFFVLIGLSYSVYLLRPSVGIKNNEYIFEYFSSENLACLGSLTLFFTMLSLMAPLCMRGSITGYALVAYSFLYDYKNSLPERFGGTLSKGLLFIMYKAPFFLVLSLPACIVDYYLLKGSMLLIKLLVLYPLLSVLVTLLYIQGIHEQYELYYGE